MDVTESGTSNFLASGGIPPNGPSASFTPAQARAATAGFVPDVHRPESYQWNIGIEHEFGSNYVFESRYLGTRGLDFLFRINSISSPIVNASNALPVYWSMPSQATLNSLPNTLGALNTIANSAAGGLVPGYFQAGFNSVITVVHALWKFGLPWLG